MQEPYNILFKIQEIRKEQQYYKERIINYQRNELEKIEDSSTYSDLQEKKNCCKKRIELLKWVLK